MKSFYYAVSLKKNTLCLYENDILHIVIIDTMRNLFKIAYIWVRANEQSLREEFASRPSVGLGLTSPKSKR